VCGVCVFAGERESVSVRHVGPVLPLHSCLLWCVVCVCVLERECVYMRRVGPVLPLHSCLLSCVVCGVYVCVYERDSVFI